MRAQPAYGGEAVFDGVMMRGRSAWSLAVRLPTGEIKVDVHSLPRWMSIGRNVPLVRGVVTLAASVSLGVRSLQDSLRYRSPETAPAGPRAMVVTGLGVLAVLSVFLGLPLAVAHAITSRAWALSMIEAVLRSAMLVGYIALLRSTAEGRNVFSYHGAEHQTIAAREAGARLDATSVTGFSRAHRRCGTSFLLLIMVIGIVVHAIVGSQSLIVLAISRVVLLPIVVGVTYEMIRWSSNHADGALARIIAVPGLALQRLTTRAADAGQVEVAIAALEAVVAADEAQDTSASRAVVAQLVAG